MDHLASVGVPVSKDKINAFLERVMAIELSGRTAHSLTIAWKKPALAPAGWIIESAAMAQVSGGSGGNFVKIWTPLKNWKIVEGGAGRVTALIDHLPPAAQIELRIMGVDRDGKISEPSPSFIITTAEAWRIPSWFWRALAVVLCSMAMYVLNKMRLGEWQWKSLRRQPKPSAG
jgi:hypothetical protein